MCVKDQPWYQDVLQTATSNAFYYDEDSMTSEEKYILLSASGTDRESFIIEDRPELKDDDHMHGYDAKIYGTEDPVEIKSEVVQGVKTPSYMSGKATWSSTMDENTIQKHERMNPFMYQTGWCKETGKCSYILKYRFGESKLADQMRKAISGSTKTAPKTSYLDFKDANVEILHFDVTTRSQMTNKFQDFIFSRCDKNQLIELLKYT